MLWGNYCRDITEGQHTAIYDELGWFFIMPDELEWSIKSVTNPKTVDETTDEGSVHLHRN